MASVIDTAKAEQTESKSRVERRFERRRARRQESPDETENTTHPFRSRRRRRWFSPITQRILALNLLALAILVAGVLYMDQYQRGLIEGRLEALTTQGLIIAAALGETVVPRDPTAPQTINPEHAAYLLQPLARPIRTRARLFQSNGELVADSLRIARARSLVEIRRLPAPQEETPLDPLLDRLNNLIDRVLIGELPHYVESPYQRAEHYAEVVRALRGQIGAQARVDADGNMVLNVAVPVVRFKAVLGSLMLTAGTDDIQSRVREVRGDILLLGLLAVAITVLLSLYLAGTIARPIRQLAAGAERVTSGWGDAQEIPDLSKRSDEIGDLSVSLRAMTEALRKRIDDIEQFAADVAHELKNPLTSLRSAVETIQRIDDPDTQKRLFAVLVEDIGRMDRLITDISAASRLDAELIRATASPVDLDELLGTLVAMQREMSSGDGPVVEFVRDQSGPVEIDGVVDRLAQVFRNLIDNAVTFSPPGGRITVRLSRRLDGAIVIVEDEGPGIPGSKTRAIFDRFYSERPAGEKFGTHSGLGLSISKQIVEAHKGTIWAENRPGDEPGSVAGARFLVKLPF